MICSFQCNISMQKLKEAVALTQTHTTNWIGYKIIVCLETIRGPGTQRNLNENDISLFNQENQETVK